MKQPNLIIKAATLLTSLLLAGGCVSHQAGLFSSSALTNAEQSAKTRSEQPGSGANSDLAVFGTTKRSMDKSNFVSDLIPAGKEP